MPLFIAAFLGALSSVAGSLVGRVLISLGLGYATFTGINTLLAAAQGSVVSGLNGLPADAVVLLGRMRVAGLSQQNIQVVIINDRSFNDGGSGFIFTKSIFRWLS